MKLDLKIGFIVLVLSVVATCCGITACSASGHVHEYTQEINVQATCTQSGYSGYACSCGDINIVESYEALGHDYDFENIAWSWSGNACNAEVICNRAGCTAETQGHVLPVETEVKSNVVVPATCSEEGSVELIASFAMDGVTYTNPDIRFQALEKLPHTEVSDNNAISATCTQTGLTSSSHCSVCDAVISERTVVAALGHDSVVDVAVTATCTTSGLTEGSHCSRCDAILTAQQEIPALGHNPVTDVAVAATCTTIGLTEGSHCSRCNTVFTAQQEIPALGHITVIDDAVAATCTKSGLTEGSHCSRCTAVLIAQQTVQPLGHNPVPDAAVAATCTTSGLTEGSHCSRCSVVLTEQHVVAALGHAVVTDPAKSATCTATGLTEGSHCSRCNIVFVAQQTIPALGHTAVTDPAKSATCTATGLAEGSHCSRCQKILVAQRIIPALGHVKVVDPAKTATCTQTGLTEGSHCSRCKMVLIAQKVVPMTDHDFGNHNALNCMVCGTVNSKFTAISNVTDLKNISVNMSGYYYLANDIDLKSENWSPIGFGIGEFKGVFDGNGKKISNLYYSVENNAQKTNSSGGLFLSNSGIIRNLTINNISVRNVFREISDDSRAHDYGNVTITFGSIAATNSGTIENCTVTGNISVYVERWLEAYYTWIKDGNYDENDRTNVYFGGIAGINNGIIDSCVNSGSNSITTKGYIKSWFGAFGGFNTSRAWTVALNGNIGGIAGTNNSKIFSCIIGGSFRYDSQLTADCKKNVATSGNICNIQNNVCVGSIIGYNASGASVSSCSSVNGKNINRNHQRTGNTDRTSLTDSIRNNEANGFYGINEGVFEGNMLK